MGDARLLAADNVAILRQGAALIHDLDDRLYGADAPGARHDGVGRQFRHVIDFYQCFFSGLPHRRVDYTARRRDSRFEKDREAAQRSLAGLIEELGREALAEDRSGLRVKLERLERADQAPDAWGDSSVSRELGFLLSHTVHHYALIKWILRVQDFPVPREFGVAPSTLRYWKEGQPAG